MLCLNCHTDMKYDGYPSGMAEASFCKRSCQIQFFKNSQQDQRILYESWLRHQRETDKQNYAQLDFSDMFKI